VNRRAFLAAAIALPITPAQAGKLNKGPETIAADCLGKPKCTDLPTCAEARRRLNDCGQKSLDRDKDGIPCESLCGDAKRRKK